MFKKEIKEEAKNIIGMIMLKGGEAVDLNNLLKDLNEHYPFKIEDINGDNNSAVFKINKEFVLIGYMPIPIPAGDIEGTAKYAYNWPSALEEIKEHKGHLIISIAKGSNDQVKRFRIFTSLVCSLFRTTASIGIYKGSQSLLIPKRDYLNDASYMNENWLPLNLWIYFGLRVNGKLNSGYTYGLKEFNKKELEIIDSKRGHHEIRELLFNISHYLLESDINFKDGQTCGISEEEKIRITLSEGKFVEGETFKLDY